MVCNTTESGIYSTRDRVGYILPERVDITIEGGVYSTTESGVYLPKKNYDIFYPREGV